MKTFEEELQQQLRPLHSMNCHSNASWFKGQKEPFPCDCFMLQLIPALIAAHQAEMDRVVEEITKETPCDWRCNIASKMGAPHQPDHQTELRVLKEVSARYKAIKEGK